MALIRRTPNPRTYKRYQRYKALLAHDFNQQCAYCEMSEGYLRTPDVFGVDHFKPFALFPELACEYSNLYYCCNSCNSYKGKAWPTAEAARAGEGFADPCSEDPYVAHFRSLANGQLEAITPIGRFTLHRIRLNREACCRFRSRRSATAQRIERLRMTLDNYLQPSVYRSAVLEALDFALEEWKEMYSQSVADDGVLEL